MTWDYRAALSIDECTKLGEQGWELVSVVWHPHMMSDFGVPGILLFYLKRPRAET